MIHKVVRISIITIRAPISKANRQEPVGFQFITRPPDLPVSAIGVTYANTYCATLPSAVVPRTSSSSSGTTERTPPSKSPQIWSM